MSLCVFVPTAADDDDDGSGASRPDGEQEVKAPFYGGRLLRAGRRGRRTHLF